MPTHRFTRTGPRALAAALAIAAALLGAAPASAAGPDAGLYGSADPTYDGVYRQSLAILALDAAGAKIPKPAVDWLVSQQCLDGTFLAYRASIRTACPAPDPVNFTGPDSNSTALAAMALAAAGRTKAAEKASAALAAAQNADGGWGYTLTGSSDVNSTGLALAALDRSSDAEAKAERRARAYLVRTLGACAKGAAALPYQAGGAPSDYATAQALLGIDGTLPVQVTKDAYTPSEKCTIATDEKLANHLVSRLKAAQGVLPNSMDPSKPDYNATAWAVYALEAAGRPAAQYASALKALTANGKAWATQGGSVNPAAAAEMALVAAAAGKDPRALGGTDYVSLLAGSIRK